MGLTKIGETSELTNPFSSIFLLSSNVEPAFYMEKILRYVRYSGTGEKQ